MSHSSIVIYGSDIRKPPLLSTEDAEIILIKDSFGDPICLLVRVLNDDMWGLATKGDKDWQDVLLKYGFATVASYDEAKEILKSTTKQ